MKHKDLEREPLSQLEILEGYRKHFMDSALWQPYVHEVCCRHGLHPCQQVRAGLAGSFPTFIVEDRWVIKFFGRLFGGELAHATELQVNRILPPDFAVRVPALLYSGSLLEHDLTWSWPYLIFEYLPGISIGEVYEQVTFGDRLVLASALGKVTSQMQRLSLDEVPLFRAGLDAYAHFFHNQRAKCLANHRQWQSLPGHLIDQLEEYLLPVETLVDPLVPHGLIHADITRDHILGRLEAGQWVTLGLIDFGDARVGNVFYDLAALHIDLFRGDARLLRAYLEAYGLEDRRQFAHKAMSAALMHEFNIFSLLGNMKPQFYTASTLGDLAEMIWDIET
jgi:hygromycin-B 7''-O-kinase